MIIKMNNDETDERLLVSDWEDGLKDVDESRNAMDKLQNDILNACEHGNIEIVKVLIKEHPELLSATDRDRYTPLHRACYSNNIDIVKYLVKQGADVGAKTDMEWEPLHSCCQWNHVECASTLIQNGADVNAKSQGNQTPLHIAATHGASYDIVQLLLMQPYIDSNMLNNSKETAGDIARRNSRFYNIFDMVDPLLGQKRIESLK